MNINELSPEQRRKAHLEKAMYSIWLKESGESNDRDVDHLKNCVRVAIKECLTPKQLSYLMMYMNGFNQIEIAQEFGIDKSTVSRTINRALDNILDHVKYASPRTLKASKKVRRSITMLYKKGD